MDNFAALTSSDTYFENFTVGETLRHARGKTVTNLENVNITTMVMNTASGHYNEHLCASLSTGKIISYGGVNLSLVLGLASQDTVENAIAELGLDKIRLRRMVTHGDTLYAYSRVLAKHDADRADAGIVVFKHWGINQRDEIVLEVERTALIKRSSHWANPVADPAP